MPQGCSQGIRPDPAVEGTAKTGVEHRTLRPDTAEKKRRLNRCAKQQGGYTP